MLLNLRQSQASSGLSFATLRTMKDLKGMKSLPSTCQFNQDDPSDLSKFTVTISPDEGYYKGGCFIFSMTIPFDYPNEPPKIKCKQTIYHPNIDLSGNVCLNILRSEWTPVLDLTTVILGVIFLFLQPNPDDPLNQEAAALLKSDERKFQSIVNRTMSGEMLNNVEYTNVLIK